MQRKSSENRCIWMDVLKIVSAYAIVLLHLSGGRFYGKYGSGGFLSGTALNVVVRFAVPCFLLVTGALTMDKTYSFAFALRKAVRYFLWLLVYTFIYLLAKSALWPDTVSDFWSMYVEALRCNNLSGHLWYLYQLVWIWMALPLVQILYQRLTMKQRGYFTVITLWLPSLIDFFHRFSEEDAVAFVPATSITPQIGYIGILVLGGLLNKLVQEYAGRRICLMSMFMCVVSVIFLFACTVYKSKWMGRAVDEFFFELRLPALLYGCSVFVMFGTSTCFLKDGIWKKTKALITYISNLLFHVYAGHCLLQWIFGIKQNSVSYLLRLAVCQFITCIFICGVGMEALTVVKKMYRKCILKGFIDTGRREGQ